MLIFKFYLRVFRFLYILKYSMYYLISSFKYDENNGFILKKPLLLLIYKIYKIGRLLFAFYDRQTLSFILSYYLV